MFRPRPIASAVVTLCFAIYQGLLSLGVARAAGDSGWQPASSAGRTRPAVGKSIHETPAANTGSANRTSAPGQPSPRWQLPNATNKPATANAAHGSRSEQQAAREPQRFQLSGSAAPLRTAQLRSSAAHTGVPMESTSAAGARASSAAVARSPAGAPRAGSAAVVNHVPASRSPMHPSLARQIHSRAPQAKRYSARVWDTVQTAFQGPEVWTAQAEDLPMPESMGPTSPPPANQMHEMHGGMIHDGYVVEHDDGMIMPYGGPGDCHDDSCSMYAGGCACGCTGGGACACEPGCACQSGENPCIVACGDDICLMGEGDPEACHTIRIGIPKWQELMVFGGVHGFKGPYDQTRDSGNFGFHEGFNVGYKVPFTNMGYQIGYRATHSQLNGDKQTNIADPHTQQFVTIGAFQRVQDGVQFGIAWDMLRDERFGAVDFHQLRSELSLIDRGCHELGVGVTVHLNDHERFLDDDGSSVLFQASDQYLLFYRMHAARGGEGRIYAGVNDDEDGILGADMLLPLKDRWSLATGFTYLIPDEPAGQQGASQEAWNIGMALVWHWDCRARSSHSNCYRPLFNVADNGYLIVDERLGAPANGNSE